MGDLPIQMLPAVPHIILGVFSLAIPNLVFWLLVIVLFFLAAWARLPKAFEPGPEKET
ncbi:hypothetical protein BMS3Abin14_01579 [bacterium BMS3Abin14]|nr:hypothetical protein BMS3Abin14_01579 [bacterium BMS3Abin14]